jgi:excinuclease UvrABC nuclease subunit
VLAQQLPFSPERDQEIFAQIPATSGVFLLRPREVGSGQDAEPYVSKSSNMRRRIARLLARPEEAGVSKRLNLRERCAAIEFAATGSDFENTVLLHRVLRAYFPKSYAKRLRLAPPALIKFDWENAYPRAYVTTKLGRLDSRAGKTAGTANTYIGPFRSRAVADKYANDALDLFKSRRCTFELNPDPAFPGCVYSEMKMCLAPCFKGCTDEEYMAETKRAEQFFVTHGESVLVPLAASRDEASEKLEFEAAKQLHERVEKIKAVAREADELVRRIDQLDAVVVQPGIDQDTVTLFRFNGCQLCGPVTVAMSEAPENSGGETPPIQPASHPAEPTAGSSGTPIRGQRYKSEALVVAIEKLEAAKKVSAAECSEHLAILKRWYYRSHKVGEIVFRNDDGSWPLRKLANACERVAKPSAVSHQELQIPQA